MTMDLLAIDKFLEDASREYLLEGKTSFSFPIRYTDSIRSKLSDVEAEIKRSGFLTIADYRDVKEGFVKVGRPSQVSFSLESLLEKRPELKKIRSSWDEALGEVKELLYLRDFIASNYAQCVKKAEKLAACVRILEYLRTHRAQVKGMFPRQIPHAESSKLILGEPLLLNLYRHVEASLLLGWEDFLNDFGLRKKPYQFQFYSPEVVVDGFRLKNHQGWVGEDSSSRLDFGDIPLLIVENEETFLALRESGLYLNLLRGGGRAVALTGFLSRLFPGPVFYWGDIDKDGYEIFALVKDLFQMASPILMDEATIDRFTSLIQNVPGAAPSVREISCGLQSAYERVCREGIRIEQEKIPIGECTKALFLI